MHYKIDVLEYVDFLNDVNESVRKNFVSILFMKKYFILFSQNFFAN